MRLNFFTNSSFDSFVIVLPNTSFQSVKERIFLKFSTDSSFMVRVDILVFGHWLCILEFKIVNSLPRNTNLSSTVQVYHFFLGSINFQFMLSLVYTVYCRKQPSEQGCSVKKGVVKDFVNFILNFILSVLFHFFLSLLIKRILLS